MFFLHQITQNYIRQIINDFYNSNYSNFMSIVEVFKKNLKMVQENLYKENLKSL